MIRGSQRGQTLNRQDAKAPGKAGMREDRLTGSRHQSLGVLAVHSDAKVGLADDRLALGRCRIGESGKEIPNAIPLGLRWLGRDFRRPSAYFYQNYRDFYQGWSMGTQLNIKSEDAYRLASRLSELTGESLTSVVTKALQAELERQERQHDIQARVDRVMEIAKEIRAHMREPVSSDTNWMYDDETGLPK